MKTTCFLLCATAVAAHAAYDANTEKYYDVSSNDFTKSLYSSVGSLNMATVSVITPNDFLQSNYTATQDIVYAKGGDTSAGIVQTSFVLTLTSVKESNILSFRSNADYHNNDGINRPYDAFGFTIDANGNLVFSRQSLTLNNGALSITPDVNNTILLTQLNANQTYNITLTSLATPNAQNTPGRGDDNFIVSVSSATGKETMSAPGFGLNGSYFSELLIGDDNGASGSVSELSLSTVPEPGTATLSLLALAALAMRRARR